MRRAALLLALALACCAKRAPKPDVEVVVTVVLPGATPEVVEQELASPLEDALAGLHGLTHLRSESRAGGVRVSVRLQGDRSASAQAVRTALQPVLPRLPTTAEPPVVLLAGGGVALRYVLEAPVAASELGAVNEELVRQRLETVDGVGSVSSCGVGRRAITIWLDPAKAAAAGLGVNEVAHAISGANLALPAGQLATPAAGGTIRILGGAPDASSLASLPLHARGVALRLSDVALIEDGLGPIDCVAALEGRRTLLGEVELQAGADRAAVRAAIQRELDKLRATLPVGFRLTEIGAPAPVALTLSLPAGVSPEAAMRVAERATAQGGHDALARWHRTSPDWIELLVADQARADELGRDLSLPGVELRAPARELALALTGPSFDLLNRAASALLQAVASSNLAFISRDGTPGALRRVVEPDASHLTSFGIAPAAVARALELLGDGAPVAMFSDRGHRLPVLLRIPLAAGGGGGTDAAALGSVRLRAASGELVPLSALVSVREVANRVVIVHVDRARQVTVWAHPGRGVSRAAALAGFRRRAASVALPPGVRLTLPE